MYNIFVDVSSALARELLTFTATIEISTGLIHFRIGDPFSYNFEPFQFYNRSYKAAARWKEARYLEKLTEYLLVAIKYYFHYILSLEEVGYSWRFFIFIYVLMYMFLTGEI